MSGVIVVATIVHRLILLIGQSKAVGGACIGFGMGACMAIIYSALLIFSALSVKRENFVDTA